jgi:hypothetical protein
VAVLAGAGRRQGGRVLVVTLATEGVAEAGSGALAEYASRL